MATGTQYSAWSAYKLPSGASAKRRVRTYYTWTTSETPTTFSIAIKAYAQMQGGSATMGGNTVTVSATGQSSVSNTFEFVYGETTLHNPVNKTYTWEKTTAAQTVTVKSTYKVASSSLFAGTYVASGTFTIPALAPATISFDANNGSGTVPTAISTYVGVANTIPSNSLTRTGYTSNGWNTASDGSGTAYATGSTITPSGDVTLYAQWKTTYVKPEIQNLLAFRTENASAGASPTVTSTGTTGFCKFQLVGGANYTFTSATVQFGTDTAKSMTKSDTTVYGYSTVGSIAEESAYTVNVTVVVTGADGISRTYTDSTYISKSVPVFDVSNDGNCFAFFGTAIDGLPSPKLLINGELALGTALSIANGGTGATTVAGARNALGLGNTSGALPIANGGTEATTAAAARTNLGLVGVETRTLLWTNASPTSVFAAQTLNSSDGIPDLSGYDSVEIVCRYSTTTDARIRYICDVGNSASMYWFYYTATDGKYTGVRSRNVVSVSTTGVTFDTCMGKPVNSSRSTTNDGYIIPIEIYGIKGV